MRKIVMAFLFCLTSSIVNAQSIIDLTKPLKCSDPKTLMNYYSKTDRKTPIWVGKTLHNSYITLLINKETHSWVMIEYDDNLACVLGVGEEKSSSNPKILL
jgi:hypothetical protein